MSKCRQCGVFIRDKTAVCPLCSCVIGSGPGQRNAYPDILLRERRLTLLCRVFLFAVLLASALLIGFNAAYYAGRAWAAIPIAGLAYAYLILRVGVASSIGYRGKTVLLLLCGVALVVLVDALAGFYGWSVNYVIPGGILLFDAAIIAVMLINLRNWQSYIMFQVGNLMCGGLSLLLWKLGVITRPLASFVALGVTAFLVLGTLIIGYRRARVELQRRFHF